MSFLRMNLSLLVCAAVGRIRVRRNLSSGPIVRVRLEFEAHFARAVYAPLMPTDIRQRLGVNDDED